MCAFDSRGSLSTRTPEAERLLAEIHPDESSPSYMAHKRREEKFTQLRQLFGFQRDSVLNQQQHLSSLLTSFMSRNGADYEAAVINVHTKLLSPAERWRENVLLNRYGSWVFFAPEGENERQPWVRLARPRAEVAEAFVADHAGIATTRGTYSTWVHMSTAQREAEIILYLCIWGEASSLRYCPEMVYFIFELARSSEVAGSRGKGAQVPNELP